VGIIAFYCGIASDLLSDNGWCWLYHAAFLG
jgi:hypothetical protein